MSSTLISAIISAVVSVAIATISQTINHYRQKRLNDQNNRHNKTIQSYNDLLIKRHQNNMAIKAVVSFEQIINNYKSKTTSSDSIAVKFNHYQSLIQSIGIWSIYLKGHTSNISNIRDALHDQFKIIDNQCWPVIEWNETVKHNKNSGYFLVKEKILL